MFMTNRPVRVSLGAFPLSFAREVSSIMRRLLILSAVLGLMASPGMPVQGDPPATGVVKDRASFMPARKWAKLPGKVVGVLLPGGREVGILDGWGGPADLMVVSVGGNSYRKTYVPTTENPQVGSLSVPVGEEGKSEVFQALNVANPRSVLPWGVTTPYSLVEVSVNSGLGSPAQDCFVATSFKVLDGSKEYPLKVTEVIGEMKKRYADFLKTQDIDKAMAELAVKTLKEKKPTGPRETSELMYVTWMPDSDTLQVRFKTKITDGAYTITKGPNPKVPPFGPRPLPPQKGGADNSVPFRALIVRPIDTQIKTGTSFGIELGAAFEVSKKGELVRVDALPIETFTQQISNPIIGPGPRPLPLPVPPVDRKPDF